MEKERIFCGQRVMLLSGGNIVGRGLVVSLDENLIHHGVRINAGYARVEVGFVVDGFIHDNDEEFAVGGFSSWRIDDLCPEGSDEPSSGESSRDDSVREEDNEVSGSSIGIPREKWMGEIVSVRCPEYGIFSTAQVCHVNIFITWEGEVVGRDHVILHFLDFKSSEFQSDLFDSLKKKYENNIFKWSVEHIVFRDGRSGRQHLDMTDWNIPSSSIYSSDSDHGMGKSSKTRRYVRARRGFKIETNKVPKVALMMQDDEISKMYKKKCCQAECTSNMSPAFIRSARATYTSKNYELKLAFVYAAMANMIQKDNGQLVIGFNNATTCSNAWRIVHNIGQTKWDGMLRDLKNGCVVTSHGNQGRKRMSERVHQSIVTMGAFIREQAEWNPAKIRTLSDNSHTVRRTLPASVNWESMRLNTNKVNVNVGLGNVSQSTISRIHAEYFPEVSIHKRGDNFSRCGKCSHFAQMKNESNTPEMKADIEEKKKRHLEENVEGRTLYYAWRDDAIRHPEASLCIMHDKMDHNKTALPRSYKIPKQLDGVQKLPITVTGIMIHGRAPQAISQYNLAVWSFDSNFTIGSLDSTLRMLEDPLPAMKRFLRHDHDTSSIFTDILGNDRESFSAEYLNAFGAPQGFDPFSSSSDLLPTKKPLPKIFRLQMDNCCADNKNRYIFAYLSLLVARGVFQEIELAFLMVGHTHEDVDAMFGHFSYALTHKDNMDLMSMVRNFFDAFANRELNILKNFGNSGNLREECNSKTPALPTFIQEVPDFKSFVEPFLLKGAEKLVGITRPRRFRFYVRDDGMPCVQYMMKSVGVPWEPDAGIELWYWKKDPKSVNPNPKTDKNWVQSLLEPKVPDLPEGVPKRLPLRTVKGYSEIVKGLEKWIYFYGSLAKNCISEDAARWENLVKYWSVVTDHVSKSDKLSHDDDFGDSLRYGFWPETRWKINVLPDYTQIVCAPTIDDHFFGQSALKPPGSYNPINDAVEGSFVLVQPGDDDLKTYPVFLGRMVGPKLLAEQPNPDGKFEHYVEVIWYEPKKRASDKTISQQWQNCMNETRVWVPFPEWVDKCVLSNVLFSFTRRRGSRCDEIKIPVHASEMAKVGLDANLVVCDRYTKR